MLTTPVPTHTKPPRSQPASWVFTTFAPNHAFIGIDSSAMVFFLSLLGSQWSMGESEDGRVQA